MSLSTTPVHLGGDKITFMGPLRFGGSILTSKLIQVYSVDVNGESSRCAFEDALRKYSYSQELYEPKH